MGHRIPVLNTDAFRATRVGHVSQSHNCCLSAVVDHRYNQDIDLRVTPVTTLLRLERFGIRVALQVGICCLLLITLQ